LNLDDLHAALKRHWGYDSFRPLQERVIQSLMASHDVAVVMPTGGGKSLCYQLPALVLGKTVVVISPLIALMHDQVAQLADMGIPAAVLNSTQPPEEQHTVMRAAVQGAFRLIYLSPERLARADTVRWLRQVSVACFAIDEAHCISEWGHEFRPEYRQLNALRQHFPEIPIAAFTASATQRVRHDILHQLQLRDPHKYIASFHRKNLRYVVHECDRQNHSKLLLEAVRAYRGESVIVYAPTIATVEDTVDDLAGKGMAAVPYHGQMDAATRRRNQETWMNDEVRVLVGTIAFGLGINKPSVRAVIHTSLPKSVEQYYQEAGRAGRDGEPSDCVLLWQPKDLGLLSFFIQKLNDAAERSRAWDRYHAIVHFAETPRCRHLQICLHFGQVPKWQRCEMCDVCGNEPEWLRGPGKARAAAAKAEEAPKASARKKQEISKTAPPASPRRNGAATELLDFFKEWRRQTAERARVPAYVVLSDAALEDLCRKRPSNLRELLAVTGFGERKAELYGAQIFARFEAFVRGERATAVKAVTASPAEETIRLLAEGKSFEEIAQVRGRSVSSVVNRVADLVEKGRLEYQIEWVGEENHRVISAAIRQLGAERLKPLHEALPEITYDQIRLVVASVRRQQTT
jgi:ATP-dependent DNA helicase RecQ